MPLNTNMGHKFNSIFESVVSRFTCGGYLPGDIIKFRPGYKKSAAYNAMPTPMKKELDELINSGLNIRVVQVGDIMSGASAGNQLKTALTAAITVAGDYGGGRHYGKITVTADMIDIADSDNTNFAKIPDQFVKKNRINIKPEVVIPNPTNVKLGESTILKNDNEAMAALWENNQKA